MGLFRKRSAEQATSGGRPSWMQDGASISVSDGREDLDVVGESYHQENLWRVVGGQTWDRVHREVVAVLVPEPENEYDPNAISVWIGGLKVGHLSRTDAPRFLPGLYAMSQREGAPVGMYGAVIGGGQRDDGLGRLGVFLRYDPTDFGLQAEARPAPAAAQMLTGESEVAVGGNRLQWLNTLPVDTMAAVRHLRHALATERDPIERHYQFNELEHRLYRSRDAFASAIAEYDEVIRQHDAEMDAIRVALLSELGQLPVFETYKQASIRHQKAKDTAGALWWAQRGLAVYGDDCCRPEAVEDLQQRVSKCEAKLSAPPKEPRARASTPKPETTEPTIETLTCQTCGGEFQRVRARGRKPGQCPGCRGESPPAESATNSGA